MPSPAAIIANAVNPLLTLCLLAAPFLTLRPDDPPLRFYARAAAGIGLAVALAEGGKSLSNSGFPSGHETFGLACATLLLSRDRRWAFPCLLLLSLLAWALVAAGFHRPFEVAGALLTGPPAAYLCEQVLNPRPPRP